jgi:anaerobic selenocysteine-containing dehydrogenase
MVSVDIYLNETTRHADVILPPPSALQREHYDLLLLQFAVRNVANFSEAVLPLDADGAGEVPDEWEILTRLGLIVAGQGIDADVAAADDAAIDGLVRSAVADRNSPIFGRDADEVKRTLGTEPGPARMLDFMLQTGPFGAAFGANPEGASLALLRANPHGVDFGPLQPRLPEILRTPSGRIDLAHPLLMADLDRLWNAMPGWVTSGLVLVGRRDLRSNNSWMHNLEVLVKGRDRCLLQMHPSDAQRLGLADGGSARVSSQVGSNVSSLVAPVEITDAIRPGVVSLPHGWGHDVAGTRLQVAGKRAGVNSNVLANHEALDPLSGTSVLNGIPVTVEPV